MKNIPRRLFCVPFPCTSSLYFQDASYLSLSPSSFTRLPAALFAAIRRHCLILFVSFSLSSLTRCLCSCSATSKQTIWRSISRLMSPRRDPFLFLFCYEPKPRTVLCNLNFTLEYVYDTRQYTGLHVRRPKHTASNLIPASASSINYLNKTKWEKSLLRCHEKPPGINLENLHM